MFEVLPRSDGKKQTFGLREFRIVIIEHSSMQTCAVTEVLYLRVGLENICSPFVFRPLLVERRSRTQQSGWPKQIAIG